MLSLYLFDVSRRHDGLAWRHGRHVTTSMAKLGVLIWLLGWPTIACSSTVVLSTHPQSSFLSSSNCSGDSILQHSSVVFERLAPQHKVHLKFEVLMGYSSHYSYIPPSSTQRNRKLVHSSATPPTQNTHGAGSLFAPTFPGSHFGAVSVELSWCQLGKLPATGRFDGELRSGGLSH